MNNNILAKRDLFDCECCTLTLSLMSSFKTSHSEPTYYHNNSQLPPSIGVTMLIVTLTRVG